MISSNVFRERLQLINSLAKSKLSLLLSEVSTLSNNNRIPRSTLFILPVAFILGIRINDKKLVVMSEPYLNPDKVINALSPGCSNTLNAIIAKDITLRTVLFIGIISDKMDSPANTSQ